MTESAEHTFYGNQYGSQKPISVFIPANIQKIAPAAFNKDTLKTIYGENDAGAAAVWAKANQVPYVDITAVASIQLDKKTLTMKLSDVYT
ncbi:MAG: hypothetical protein RR900_09740, partial [Ruthenibacterium sp.]